MAWWSISCDNSGGDKGYNDMSSDVDCREASAGISRCFCKNAEDCCFVKQCKEHGWLRKDIKINGYYVCQRPWGEKPEDEPDATGQ